MCGYDPFWILEERLEQEYKERMEQEMEEFAMQLRFMTDDELKNQLYEAEEYQCGEMRERIIKEINRRTKNA